MNPVLRLVLLALICFAVTVLLYISINTIVTATAECYQTVDCSRTPILGTMAFSFDALKNVSYFAIFPFGMIFGRRDFRKLFKNRLMRRIARLAFALIPVLFLPLRHFLDTSFY